LKRLFLILITLLFSTSVFAAGSETISFTKKEIAFFKWGNKDKEVGCNKIDEIVHHGSDPKNTSRFRSFRAPVDLKIDGNGNVYIDGWNQRIFVISPDGRSIKTINNKTTGGFSAVDEEGDIYGSYYKEGEPFGFIRTTPDGTQEIHKDFKLSYVENGIAYEKIKKNIRSLKLFDVGDKPEKLPVRLSLWSYSENVKADLKIDQVNGVFTIDTKKINKHLKKINRKLNSDKIQINYDDKNGVRVGIDFLGIDDDGNSFFLHYSPQLHADDPWSDVSVNVYSSAGQKVSKIPIESDYFSQQLYTNEFAIDIQGNLFQMSEEKDGVHILKWSKIKP